MEKIKFMSEEMQEEAEFFVLEQTKVNGVSYILVTDSEEDDAECLILKDLSKVSIKRCQRCSNIMRKICNCLLQMFFIFPCIVLNLLRHVKYLIDTVHKLFELFKRNRYRKAKICLIFF